MKARYRLSQRAVDDLGEIWDFIAADDPLAADGFIARLLDVVERVGEAPRIGRWRDDLLPGIRSIPHGSYLIFYLLASDDVALCASVALWFHDPHMDPLRALPPFATRCKGTVIFPANRENLRQHKPNPSPSPSAAA